MSAPIRHLVWDWNGTLLDDVAACVAAINCMLAARGLPAVVPDAYRELFQFPVRGYYRQLGFDLEREDWDCMAEEFHVHYRRCARTAALRAGAREVLESLRAAGLPMSVLSASEEGLLRGMLAAHGLLPFFGEIAALGNLHAASKLDAGRALHARLALPPEAVVLVGDTTHDFEVAADFGWQCILVADGHQSEPRLRACGCPVVGDLAAVAARVLRRG